jgi:hypothetical protein
MFSPAAAALFQSSLKGSPKDHLASQRNVEAVTGVTPAGAPGGISDEIDIVGEASSTAPHCWHPPAGSTFCVPQNLQRITVALGKTEARLIRTS